MRTLRNRLVLSHIVPFLLIVPLVGIALIYLLETQVLLPSLAAELQEESGLATELAGEFPGIWTDQTEAEALAQRIDPHITARIMFVATDGRILASTGTDDANGAGEVLADEDYQQLQSVLGGQPNVEIQYSQRLQAEVADVFAPVRGRDGQVQGVVRLTHQLGGVAERFQQLRNVVLAVLIAGLLFGGGVGLALALNIERPLRNATRAIERLAGGRQPPAGAHTPLLEQGPQEIKTLLHAFNTLAERLRTAEETRRQLLANLVHELGRPLGAFYSALQALQGGADTDEKLRRELLLGMEAEVHGMQRLLEDLVGLHNQASGGFELHLRPIDVGEWLPGVLGPWREAAHRKGLIWEIDIPEPGAIPTVEADPDRLAQAIGNLLSNAIKYTPAGGKVAIAAGCEAAETWIRVRDTGRGIEEEEQARVFEPFYRSGTQLLYPEGMGLGLAITRALVAAHGGRLELESVPDAGSSFTIRLPVSSPQAVLNPP